MRGGVALNAGPRPVVEGLTHALLTGIAHVHEEGALATAFGDGRGASVGA